MPAGRPAGLSLTDEVVVSVQSLLFTEFPVGSTLPAESRLAERFGVSRLTIREALKILSGRGLVDLRQGRRAVVTQPSSTITSSVFASYIRQDPSSYLELIEVRLALEVQSATLAAQRRTRAGLGAMEAALDQMAQAAYAFDEATDDEARRLQAYALYQEADLAFHESIALATGNRMLAHVLEALAESLLTSFQTSFAGHLSRGGSARDTYLTHLRILEAIRAGDPAAAARAMHRQLQHSERDLRAALTASVGHPASDVMPTSDPATDVTPVGVTPADPDPALTIEEARS
ncbi:MAG: FadR family transcriptional regulator [Actinomycetales bacterium]|nr:FadR family transcriptional regulator [Actinomycetales bacterium]